MHWRVSLDYLTDLKGKIRKRDVDEGLLPESNSRAAAGCEMEEAPAGCLDADRAPKSLLTNLSKRTALAAPADEERVVKED